MACLTGHDDIIIMDTFSVLLALCEGNPLVTGGFPPQRASDAELWCVIGCQLKPADEQTAELPVIWDSMILMWCQCNGWMQVNSFWPSDTKWRHRYWSTLAQVMACCLTAPSHYLNQYWLIISTHQGRLSKGNFTRDTYPSHHSRKTASICLNKISFKSPRGQWVNDVNIFTNKTNLD